MWNYIAAKPCGCDASFSPVLSDWAFSALMLNGKKNSLLLFPTKHLWNGPQKYLEYRLLYIILVSIKMTLIARSWLFNSSSFNKEENISILSTWSLKQAIPRLIQLTGLKAIVDFFTMISLAFYHSPPPFLESMKCYSQVFKISALAPSFKSSCSRM